MFGARSAPAAGDDHTRTYAQWLELVACTYQHFEFAQQTQSTLMVWSCGKFRSDFLYTNFVSICLRLCEALKLRSTMDYVSIQFVFTLLVGSTIFFFFLYFRLIYEWSLKCTALIHTHNFQSNKLNQRNDTFLSFTIAQCIRRLVVGLILVQNTFVAQFTHGKNAAKHRCRKKKNIFLLEIHFSLDWPPKMHFTKSRSPTGGCSLFLDLAKMKSFRFRDVYESKIRKSTKSRIKFRRFVSSVFPLRFFFFCLIFNFYSLAASASTLAASASTSALTLTTKLGSKSKTWDTRTSVANDAQKHNKQRQRRRTALHLMTHFFSNEICCIFTRFHCVSSSSNSNFNSNSLCTPRRIHTQTCTRTRRHGSV